jgi:biotin carboxyl carrier protein
VTSAARPSRFTALVGEQEHQVELLELGEGRYQVTVDDRTHVVDSQQMGPLTFSLLIDHAASEVNVLLAGDRVAVEIGGRTHRLRLFDERASRRRAQGAGDGERELRAVMPGKVVAVLVEVGTTVERGQGMLVIEAMKMENEIVASRAGTVRELRVQPGQAVEAGELLAIIE